MGYVSSRICDDLASPIGAYERAYKLCQKAVMLEKQSKTYIGPAIQSLTEKGQFGSWLRKLFHREKVTIHLHYYERLVLIVEQLAATEKRRIEHIEDMIRMVKGTANAVDESDMEIPERADRARHESA